LKSVALTLAFVALTAPAARAQAASGSSADSAAIAAARRWVALVDAGKYEASWDSAAALFRAALTKAQWVPAVGQAREPFEPFGARALLTSRYTRTLPNAPPGEYVILTYRTGVGAGRSVLETIVPMKDADGSWRVSGYFVRPQ
jgi:hypothetical protein